MKNLLNLDSLDGLLSQFKHLDRRLEALVQRRQEDVEHAEGKISEASKRKREAIDEIARAGRIRNRIQEFVR